jgi:hypothetical protein
MQQTVSPILTHFTTPALAAPLVKDTAESVSDGCLWLMRQAIGTTYQLEEGLFVEMAPYHPVIRLMWGLLAFTIFSWLTLIGCIVHQFTESQAEHISDSALDREAADWWTKVQAADANKISLLFQETSAKPYLLDLLTNDDDIDRFIELFKTTVQKQLISKACALIGVVVVGMLDPEKFDAHEQLLCHIHDEIPNLFEACMRSPGLLDAMKVNDPLIKRLRATAHVDWIDNMRSNLLKLMGLS